ncbi:hypothetical protein NIES4071_49340 [Calothrix sp. NIES-4071]|nr:hypothetical protein NIES4071_49340 [Calothrix sp. NIES-4071]BAZ59245.1 hypothetical protein NIES4105_49280 [Calothrix sp. NIES-4105]
MPLYMTFFGKYSVIRLILLFFIVVGITAIWTSQVATAISFSSYQAVDVKDGAGLYKKQLSNGNEAYLQVINLQKMQMDQILGSEDGKGLGKGKYYRGEGKYNSPFFIRKSFEEVLKNYQNLHKDKVFSIINCAFFEEYKSSTQLSFPAKLNGKVVTGGSSPYGPVRKPANKYYANIRLKALVWDQNRVYITDYNSATGAPLNRPSVKNAIVTYAANDHPAKVLARNQINRYHVIGTLDKDGKKGDELLLILTVNRATLDEASRQLRLLGVKSNVITIDGGSSTYLFNSRLGNIMLPFAADNSPGLAIRNLPHYLGVRYK